MKGLWTRHAIPVCMPPAISEHSMHCIANRKEDESETTNGNRIRRIENGISERNETVHWERR